MLLPRLFYCAPQHSGGPVWKQSSVKAASVDRVAFPIRVSDADLSVEERLRALVVPVSSGRRFKAPEYVAIASRRLGRIEEYGLSAAACFRQ